MGAVYARRTSSNPVPSIFLFSTLALAPDVDFVVAPFGVDGTPLEHRAMTHAIPFAAAVALVIGAVLGRAPHRFTLWVSCLLALASHGILDAMTSNVPGPQLWWPFTAAHIQLVWQPIPGTRTWQEYFTWGAAPILARETLLSAPLMLAAVWVLRERVGRGLAQQVSDCRDAAG